MKMTKKVLAVVMAIAMLLCMAPMSFAATNVASVNGVEYATLKDAVNAAADGDTVVLLDDALVSNNVKDLVSVAGKSITLDLNGKTYAQYVLSGGKGVAAIAVRANAELTVIDSSAEGTGKITATTTAIQVSGTLNLVSGAIACDVKNSPADDTAWPVYMYAASNTDKPTFNMTGGEILLGEDQREVEWAASIGFYEGHAADLYKNFTVAISDGYVEGGFLFEDGANVAITGGTFTDDISDYAALVENADGTFSVAAVSLNGVGYATVADAVANAADGAVINLNADVAEAKAVTVNKNIAINLNGYTWNLAKTDNYAVVVKGALTINGDGTVIADTAYGFGTSTTCTGGITVNGGTYIGTENNVYLFAGYAGVIKLVDGTFESDYCIANAIYGYDAEVIVLGGDYTITDYVTYPEASTVLGENVAVYGGTHSNAPAYYQCAEGFVCVKNADGTFGMKAGKNVAVTQIAADYVGFETLAEAIAAAADGGEVYLVDDVTDTKAITIDKDITINLDGNTWTLAKASNYAVVVKGNLTINGDGTVIADTAYGFGTSTTCKGGITINGGTYIGTENNIYLFAGYAGVIKLVDGTFESDYCIANAFDGYTGEVIILDGSYTITDYVTYPYASTVFGTNVAVYGGTHSNAINYYHCADGFVCVENADGTYGIKAGNAVAIADVGDYRYVAYETLAEAVANAVDGGEVYLLDNAEGTGIVIDKDVTIDFGGYTYTFTNPAVGSTGTKTLGFQILKDNDVTLKNGTLEVAEANANDYGMLIQNYADLTITDMKLDGTNLKRNNYSYVLSNNSGEVLVNGATDIIASKDDTGYAFDVCKYSNYALPTVTIDTTGTISGIVEVTGGNLVAEAGTFVSDGYAIRVISGTADLKEGVSVTGDCAIFVKGGSLTTAADVTSIGDFAAISGNGYYAGDITITGGTIKDDGIAVYFPQNGKLTITGGTIEGATAVYAKQGTVAITGGTLIANGEAVDYKYSGNGANATGDALVIDTCGYGTINVSVTGGTFKSENAAGIASYATTGNEAATGFVAGGTFNTAIADELAAEGLEVVKNADGTYGVQEADVNGFLTLKAQTTTDGTQLRFITTIDTLQYREVGFVITNADNTAQTTTKTSKVVYSSIVAGGNVYNAAQISGDANMNYILTYTVTGIPASAQGIRYLVKPFVVTLDGQTVYGDAKTFCVADMIG